MNEARNSQATGKPGNRLVSLRQAGNRLLAFALIFLAHLLTDPSGSYHELICGELDRAVLPGARLVGAIPREHAKTTLGTVALTLREICAGQKRNIMLIAANREEAKTKLRQIVSELETNTCLQEAFGDRLAPARDEKKHLVAYGDAEVVLAGGARITTLGFGGKVRGQLSGGRRLDLAILDDPEDDLSVESPLLRRRLSDWVDRALLNALDVRTGSLVWLGTLLHHDSGLARLLDRHQPGKTPGKNLWRVLRLPAIGEDGSPLWPERWSRERLELRRSEIGDRAFAQEYLNQPASLAEQLFRPGDFRSYDASRLIRAGGEWSLAGEPLTVAIGIDPAIGTDLQHDYFAAATVGITRGKLVYLLDMLQRKLRFPEQLELIRELTARWHPRLIGIEAVAYQAALAQAVWDLGLPAKPQPGTQRKADRISAVAVHAAQGRVFLPDCAPWLAGFRQEAGDYPCGSHDDQLDALARAVETALPLIAGVGELKAEGPQRKNQADGFFLKDDARWDERF